MGDRIAMMTQENRVKLQRKLLYNNYEDILDNQDRKQYWLKLNKMRAPVFGMMVAAPYVFYALRTLKENEDRKAKRIIGALGLQFGLLILNFYWQKQFFLYE